MKVNIAFLALVVLIAGCANDEFSMRARVETLEQEVSTLRHEQAQLAADSQSNSEAIGRLAVASAKNSQSITEVGAATMTNIHSIRMVAEMARRNSLTGGSRYERVGVFSA